MAQLRGKEKGIALMQTLGNSVTCLPYTLVLDTQGNIVAVRLGPINSARLEQVLLEAIRNTTIQTKESETPR